MFDFFGFMWTCIVVNFVQIIFVIAGLFGVCQDRAKIVVAVSIYKLYWGMHFLLIHYNDSVKMKPHHL